MPSTLRLGLARDTEGYNTDFDLELEELKLRSRVD
jgi:hypothetical protein